jgi:hypothetical protein
VRARTEASVHADVVRRMRQVASTVNAGESTCGRDARLR